MLHLFNSAPVLPNLFLYFLHLFNLYLWHFWLKFFMTSSVKYLYSSIQWFGVYQKNIVLKCAWI